MYTHIIKGATVGKVLTQRLLRALIGLVGVPLDAIIVAPWANQNYFDFWDEKSSLGFSYMDDTKQVGFFQVGFGYIGDFFGAGIGFILGAIVGGLLWIPDRVLCGLCLLHNKIVAKLDQIAKAVGSGRYKFFENLPGITNDPQNIIDKTGNFFAATLGVLLGSLFYLAAKGIEYVCFFPEEDNMLSNAAWGFGTVPCSIIGCFAGIALYVPARICQKLVEAYYGVDGVGGFRDWVRCAVAFIYAKTGSDPETPVKDSDQVFFETGTHVHSERFINKVKSYKSDDWDDIIFGGPLKADGTTKGVNSSLNGHNKKAGQRPLESKGVNKLPATNPEVTAGPRPALFSRPFSDELTILKKPTAPIAGVSSAVSSVNTPAATPTPGSNDNSLRDDDTSTQTLTMYLPTHT